MTPEDEERIGRLYAHAMARSARRTVWTYRAAVVLGWSAEDIERYIETGEQPAGKEFGSEAP